MTFGSVARLAGVAAVFLLMLGPPVGAQMRSGTQSVSGLQACSGRGETRFDRCFCDPGWTGAQCELRETPPNCGDHGKASNMRCVCEAGWIGKSCEMACVRGKAAHGKCACAPGWSGAACDVGSTPP
jgi:hypothetical protein